MGTCSYGTPNVSYTSNPAWRGPIGNQNLKSSSGSDILSSFKNEGLILSTICSGVARPSRLPGLSEILPGQTLCISAVAKEDTRVL